MIRILLADDHVLFRKGLRALLETQDDFKVVEEAADGEQAADLAASHRPDVVILDINMPKLSGLEALARIKAAAPDTRVVMLTISDAGRDVFEAVKLGAHGYVLKNAAPEELFLVLRGVARGEAAISGALAAKILQDIEARPAASAAPAARLSERENQVLRLVAQGLTNKDIASNLGIAENTVKNHLRNILDKLHLDNRVQLAAYAAKSGMVPDNHP